VATCCLDVQQLEVADSQRGGACTQQRDQRRRRHCTAGQQLGKQLQCSAKSPLQGKRRLWHPETTMERLTTRQEVASVLLLHLCCVRWRSN
jgi:hypothetical protein